MSRTGMGMKASFGSRSLEHLVGEFRDLVNECGVWSSLGNFNTSLMERRGLLFRTVNISEFVASFTPDDGLVVAYDGFADVGFNYYYASVTV